MSFNNHDGGDPNAVKYVKDFDVQKNNEQFIGKTLSDFTKMNNNTNVLGKIKEELILNSTNKFKWSKEVYYDGTIDCYNRTLKQLFLDEKGNEHWINVEVEE